MADKWLHTTLAALVNGRVRHGIYKPLDTFGSGTRVLKMGLQYAEDRIGPQDMERTQLSQDEIQRFRVHEGDLLFSRTSMMSEGAGKCSIAVAHSEAFVFDGNILCVTLDGTAADPAFYYYYFRSPTGRQAIAEIIAGTQSRSLSSSSLADISLPHPSLPEQRAIAHILGSLDDKIELNRRMNETLEGIARAIFKSWFVDFGPVRAKAEGRNPGLPKPIADIFPDSFEDSELGEIPLGWEVKRAGDAVRAVGGGTPSTQEQKYWDGGDYHWVTPKDLSGLIAPILLDTERKITEAGLSQISSGLLPAGTVLMSSRAPVGYLALAAMPVAINQGFIGMVCDGSVSNYYTINWCHYNMDEIKQRASGTTFAEISKAAFRPIPMLIPRKTVMHAFTNKVAPLYDAIKIKLEESRTLAALRDALLPKLISGELRVRAAERIVGRIL